MKKLWNSFKVAFTMYSKIPMPYADFNKDSMEYAMCVFPLIGAIIGGIMILWYQLMMIAPFQHGVTTIGYVLIPLLITGGIHLDGFIDTIDAKKSYQPKDKKLEILKDPHIGAFALIYTILYFLAMVGIWSEVEKRALEVLAVGFVLSRSLSGLSVVIFPKAKNTGLASMFSEHARKKEVTIILLCYIILCTIGMFVLQPILGGLACLTAICTYLYYYRLSKNQFGGMTGDLAGYFLQSCELYMAVIVITVNLFL